METSSRQSKNKKRVFKESLFLQHFSVFMAIMYIAGYKCFYAIGKEMGVLTYFKSVSFEVFLLCVAGIVSLTVFNKKKLDGFLHHCPVIRTKSEIETLKPIIRTNMYLALFIIFFYGLFALTGIMSILNFDVKSIVVFLVSVMPWSWLSGSGKTSVEKIKHIECANELLEQDLNNMLQCWMHKLFPNF